MNRLKKIGFFRVGSWLESGGLLCLRLDEKPLERNVLYAFVSGETLLYIGKTTSTLMTRLRGYTSPGPTQRTNIRNQASLLQTLAHGQEVEIWALPDSGLFEIGGFRLNIAAGLEDDIIRQMRPPWNGGKKDMLVPVAGDGGGTEEVVELVDRAAEG